MSEAFDFERLAELCQRTHEVTRHSATRAVDRSLVVRNWLFGWYIVEFEQSGADRAEYGRQTLKRLSKALKARIGRGFSVDTLERMRRFYIAHGDVLSDVRPSDISATPLRISGNQPISATSLRISPGPWTPTARRFYEIEASENDWSVRELKRQLDSSLYQRLALSRDKHEVRRLAREGQVVEKASDLIKDPVVLEFLGLEETPAYSESDLETAIIDLTNRSRSI